MEATLPGSRRPPIDGSACRELWSGLRYTPGVKALLEGANAAWFLNVIAILQQKAARDRWLREFQLWELFAKPDRRVVIVCSLDSEHVAFRLAFGRIDFARRYVRVYVTRGIVCLPSEDPVVRNL